MIKIENVSKYYQSSTNPVKALDNINLNLNVNEFVAITGESGSGKSTLLNILTGMDNYDDGEIYFKGNKTSYFDQNDLEEFRKKHVSYILQNYGLIDSYTVLDNVMLPLLINRLDTKVAKEKALTLIKEVNLEDKINTRVSLLSGGEKQRVSIARALISDKEILACDEITANLDSETSKEIVALVKRLAKDKLVLFVTHDYNIVKDIATRHIVLADGKIIIDNNATNDVDNREVLDLNYSPLTFKDRLHLALNNIKACPKKTIFNSVILIIISVIISMLFMFINITSSEQLNTYNYSNAIIKDKYYLSYKDNNLDIKGNVNEYAILEGAKFSISVDNLMYDTYFTNYRLNDDSLVKYVGSDIKDTNDVILYIPPYIDYDFLNTRIRLLNRRFNVVGIGYSNYVSDILVYVNTNDKKLLEDIIIFSITDVIHRYIPDINASYDNSIDRPRLQISKFNSNDTFMFGETNLKEISSIFVSNQGNFFTFNDEFIEKYVKGAICSVYSNDEKEVKHNLNELEKNNVSYYYPILEEEVDLSTKTIKILSIIGSLVISTLLYFIIASIITRLNHSSIKDYSIYRMLGVSKRDNKYIIYFYNFILSFIIFNIIYISFYFIFRIKWVFNFNFVLYLIYLFGIVLFNYFITKNTVNKVYDKASIRNLKEE